MSTLTSVGSTNSLNQELGRPESTSKGSKITAFFKRFLISGGSDRPHPSETSSNQTTLTHLEITWGNRQVRGNDDKEMSERPPLPSGSVLRSQGSSPRSQGSSPRSQGSSPRSQGSSPRSQGSSPRSQVGVSGLQSGHENVMARLKYLAELTENGDDSPLVILENLIREAQGLQIDVSDSQDREHRLRGQNEALRKENSDLTQTVKKLEDTQDHVEKIIEKATAEGKRQVRAQGDEILKKREVDLYETQQELQATQRKLQATQENLERTQGNLLKASKIAMELMKGNGKESDSDSEF